MIPIQFTLLLGVALWLCAVVVLYATTPSLAEHHAARIRYVRRHLDKLKCNNSQRRHHHRHKKKHTVITLDEE